MLRGEIFYANLGNEENGSVQNGIRPVLILSNNIGNEYSSTVIVAPLTSKNKRRDLPVHILITRDKENGLTFNSVVLLEHIITLDKNRLYNKIGAVCDEDMEK